MTTRLLQLFTLSILLLTASCIDDDYVPEAVPAPVITDSVGNLYLDITADTTLTDHNIGTDYRIANCLKIRNGATLTIEPGVTIEVVQNGCIEVIEGAALKINGTSNKRVLFTGQSKTKGFWRGIYFSNTTNPNNLIRNCIIEFAGAEISDVNKKAAVNVYNATISLDSCIIRNNKSFALHLDTAVTSFSMHNCTLTLNDAQPVMMYHTNCDFLTGDNLFTGNVDDKILIKSLVLINGMRNQTFKKLPVPYSIEGTARFAKKLTFEPGVRIVMQNLSYLYMDNSITGQAEIAANGVSGDSVIFQGLKADSGQWQGIGFYSGGTGNFNYCRISNAGTGSTFNNSPNGLLTMSGPGTGSLTVRRTQLKYSTFNGIVIKTPEVTYNTDIETINSFVFINASNVVYY